MCFEIICVGRLIREWRNFLHQQLINPIHPQLDRYNSGNASYAASGERECHFRESRAEGHQHITILAENQYVSEHKAICNF